MAHVFVIENEIPDEASVEVKLSKLFPPSPARPAGLEMLVARTAASALEHLHLDPSWAGTVIPARWDDVPPPIRTRLAATEPNANLYGISCDLEIPAHPRSIPDREVGKNLLRLLGHWRNQHPNRHFQLIVCSHFDDEQVNLTGFYDRFYKKIDRPK